MKKIKIITLLLAIALVLPTLNGCKKGFLDVNKNPNNPESVDINFLLPAAQANIAHALGYNLSIFGGFWSQYWTQSPSASQYRTVDSYSPASTDFDDPWDMLYVGAMNNLKIIETKSKADGKLNYTGISKLLQAYTMQVVTDNWGDVPFSEANQAAEGILTPKYDKQADIYTGIIKLAKAGLVDINKASTSATAVLPGSDDLIYQGDMVKWQAFGNTLLLKIYLRMADANPTVAQAGIVALTGPFIADGESAQIIYNSTGGNENPMSAAINGPVLSGVHNLFASATIIDTLNTLADARIDGFFTDYVGIPQGAYATNTTAGKAEPSALVGALAGDATSANAPVKFITDYESYFLQSEAVARGWMTGTAGELYLGGINASFVTYGFDTTGTGYDAQPGVDWSTASSLTAKLHLIAKQKWIAMCENQNAEAWAEVRRFDYPVFEISAAAGGITGGKFPARLIYPSTEVTRNPNTPGGVAITTKMWWDKH